MATDKNIQQKIDAAMAGFDGMQRAAPAPYFDTRLRAAIASWQKEDQSVWSRLAAILSKPVVSVSLMLVFLLANLLILLKKDTADVDSTVSTNAASYDYASTMVSSYDFENVQP